MDKLTVKKKFGGGIEIWREKTNCSVCINIPAGVLVEFVHAIDFITQPYRTPGEIVSININPNMEKNNG